MYYAHSTRTLDRSHWQLLAHHLAAVGDLSERFGDRTGFGRAARLAGLLHDLGKYTAAFQARLSGGSERVDHSTAGAAIVTRLGKGHDRLVAELVAYAIAGHHAGLPDKLGASSGSLAERLAAFSDAALDPAWRSELSPEASGLLPDFDWERIDMARAAFQLALLGRMIFSCLVDADFRDTERFYAHIEGRKIDRDWSPLQSILPRLIASFDTHMDGMRDATTPVNCLRSEILDHVRSQAGHAPGLFTLTVPTGGGKTLASLGFALDHAKAHSHDRIIYAIPFTSIIDQTAAIFGTVLGKGVVLEHHSAIEENRPSPREALVADSAWADTQKLKLAMEDWAAPVVVTTNVQFFESLFAARTSRCRKLHNIGRSVIVLDEAQTIPRPLLVPAVWTLRELARNYGCTIILCTATQPALDERKFASGHRAGLPLAGRELAPHPHGLAKRLKRVRLVHAGEMSNEELLSELENERQALVIVNSRKHALDLYRMAKEEGLEGPIHLTTRQYAAHRRQILNEVRRRLQSTTDEPCALIATSLVEAGIDLDFPKVWRAEAGLDQIAQAAGRCNREGRRPVDESIVTIFTAPDYPAPAEIKGLSGDMGRIMGRHDDLLSMPAMEDFFGEVYWRFGEKGLDAKDILDDFRLGSGGTNFRYRSVAERFRMIESGMAPVIVAGDAIARAAVDQLGIESIPSAAIARELQPYTVQVPPKARARLIACGHVKLVEEGKRRDQFAVLITESLYTEVGLLWEDAEYLALEGLVI